MSLISTLKQHLIEKASDPAFIHHKWFVKYHLEIVEKIALQLAKKYPSTDKDLLLTLVWMHDYGKIIEFNNQYNATHEKGAKFMQGIGFNNTFIETVLRHISALDKKKDLNKYPCIEVKIVSTADALSHLVGPFFALYWYENPDMPIQKIMKENLRKFNTDWEQKIVLPYIKRKYNSKRQSFLEMFSDTHINTFIDNNE